MTQVAKRFYVENDIVRPVSTCERNSVFIKPELVQI